MAVVQFDLNKILDRVVANAPWLQFPSFVASRSPADHSCSLTWRIDSCSVHEDFRINLRQSTLDLWSRVLGRCPPMPGAMLQLGENKLMSLADAHACFLGVNRPFDEDDNGENILAYVIKPRVCFEYKPSLSGVAKLMILPTDVVFVVYVKLDVAYNLFIANPGGVVTHWSTVEADTIESRLPRDQLVRFGKRLW